MAGPRRGKADLVLEFTRVGSALRLHIVLRGIIQDATDAVLVQVVQRGLDVLLILPCTSATTSVISYIHRNRDYL